MFNIDLAIKFGSNEIIIYRKGFGIVAKEPAYLAVEENGKRIKVKEYGKKAEKMFLTGSGDVTIYQPIKNSEIVNEKMAEILINGILNDLIKDKFMLSKLSALVAVPCALNEKQLKLLKKVLHSSGVNKIIFVQNAVCARQNLELDTHARIMVVDIGKYITDISVLNDFSFDFGRMYFVGGSNMDTSLTTFIQDNHELEVSDLTSEAIKNEIASLYERDFYKTEYIGIDKDDKFIKNSITANEVRVAIQNSYDSIFKLVKDVIKELPKEIAEDIYTNGIYFVGGASSISGLYEYASKKLEMPVIVADEPKDEVIKGAGKLLSKKSFLKIEF